MSCQLKRLRLWHRGQPRNEGKMRKPPTSSIQQHPLEILYLSPQRQVLIPGRSEFVPDRFQETVTFRYVAFECRDVFCGWWLVMLFEGGHRMRIDRTRVQK
jgi:hypothetical protein